MERDMNGTTMTNPTRFLDSPDNKETVEVGVIVVGLCCICLVACALVILQLRSNNRRITGSRQRSGDESGRPGDRTRDHLDLDAPPSYDTVIRSPYLYPPSRRTSLTLDVSDTRRSSGSSVFSLSLQSPRCIHHSHIVPRGPSEDNLSQHSDVQEMVYQQEENEGPPPPYPGNIILIAPCHAPAVHSVVHPVNENSRNQESETTDENISSFSNRESFEGQTERPGSSMVNGWTDNQVEIGASRGEMDKPCTSRRMQLNSQERNINNQRNSSVSRTLVSHSSQGPKEMVSTSHNLPSEHV